MEVEIIKEDWIRGKEFKDSWLPSEGIDSFLDLELAGKLVIQAMEQQERIALVTDYDCDGICSAVMSRKFFLDYLGYKNIVTIVNRRNWGNGLNQHLLENIIAEHRENKIGLAISFDHTIGNEVEIRKLKNMTGMKYVLTDHHSITKVYPKSADAVVNVMRQDNFFLNGMKGISGCHTGYLLCAMIYKLLGKDVQDLYPLSLYSGITTVVDQMDMSHEYNARVVRSGMRSCDIKEPSCRGLITELDLPLMLKNKNLGWGIGPYINSGNRCNLEPEVFTSIMEADERCYQVATLENKRKKEEQKEISEKIYNKLLEEKVEVLYDDRIERPGVKFNDADLIGLPIQIIVGRKADEGIVEIKVRKTGEREEVLIENLYKKLHEIIKNLA